MLEDNLVTPDMISKPLDAGAQYGSAGPFIIVVLIFVAFLLVAGIGMLRYLTARDRLHNETVTAIVSDAKESYKLVTDTVRQCTANQVSRGGR